MTQYIDKAALVAEIESKIEKYTKRGEESDAKRDGYGMYWGGVLSCLNEVRTLCDTLEVKEVQEEPVSEELEEAANSCSSCIYLEEVLSDDDKEVLKERLVNTFKAGAQWQKEQMMKDAVYGLVCGHDESSPAWIDLNLLNKPNVKVGTEVKLIIIKDE